MTSKPPENETTGLFEGGFIKAITLLSERVTNFKKYPFSIPAVREMKTLEFHPKVTFFVGENGSGKSTLVEAIAVLAGFNAEGGSRNFNFKTRSTESTLYEAFQVKRGARRETDGFFLRAESLYNVATQIEKLDKIGRQSRGGTPSLFDSYGGKSLHVQSHGESFMALVTNRFRGNGFYVLDEPESALSPMRQLALLRSIHLLVQERKSQFVIATHSPILMAYPDSRIYCLSAHGVSPIMYEETEHFQVTRDFLMNRDSFMHHLFNE